MKHIAAVERLRRLLGRSEDAKYRVGVLIRPDSVALAVFSQDAGGRLQAAESVAVGREGVGGTLRDLVARYGLAGAPAHIVLAAEEFESQQIDLPGVPEAELVGAARLRVRDLSTIPLEEACVAVRRLYSDRKPDGGAMVSVALARSEAVEARVAQVRDSGLQPVQVLPRDFALCKLAAQMPDPEQGLALLHIGPDRGLILIARGERLYLTRGHRYGARAIEEQGERAIQGIVLETQRSLDYYDSQLATAPVGQLLVLPARTDRSAVVEGLNEVLGVPALRVDLRQVLDYEASAEQALVDEQQWEILLAVAVGMPAVDPPGVSFYEPPSERFEPLGASAIAGYIGSAVLIAAIASAGQFAWVRALEERAAEAESVQAEAQSRRDELEAELEALEPDDALLARRDELANQAQLRERLAKTLVELDQRRGVGFAGTFDTLGRNRVEGVWLTRIRLIDGDLTLEGRAVRADLLPEYLDRLAGEAGLDGVRFERFELVRVAEFEAASAEHDEDNGSDLAQSVLRPELGGVRFVIATEPTE